MSDKKKEKVWRITYRMEVYIKGAETEREALDKFENMPRKELDKKSEYVERVSVDEEE